MSSQDKEDLVGSWIKIGDRLEPDEVTKRIEYLTERVLARIGASNDGWSTLYYDNSNGRYWELTYPQSEMHGGGAPRLKVISQADAKAKYH
jgi:hypothetical protein